MKRKKTGRMDNELGMSLYAGYSKHYVCFVCCKMFNQVSQWHWHRGWLKSPKKGYPCPECGAAMTNAGLNFKPPRRNNIKQWRKVELLLQRGYKWDCEYVRRDVPPGYRWPDGAIPREYNMERVFNDPRARTLREARQDYPPRVDEKK